MPCLVTHNTCARAWHYLTDSFLSWIGTQKVRYIIYIMWKHEWGET